MSTTTWNFNTDEVRRFVDIICRAGDSADNTIGVFALTTTMLRPHEVYDLARIDGKTLIVSESMAGSIVVPGRKVPASVAARQVFGTGAIGVTLGHAGLRTLHELRTGLAGDGMPHLEEIREAAVAAALSAATTPQLKRAVCVYAGLMDVPVTDTDLRAVGDFLDRCVTRAGYTLATGELEAAA